MTVLVTGGHGQMAAVLREFLPDAIYLGRDELDVRNQDSVDDAVAKFGPSTILHAAAITDHQCPDHELIRRTNVRGTMNVADAARRAKARLVYLSTHYVYPGVTGDYREWDAENPIGVYAHSKLKGEDYVINSRTGYLVIRCSWYTKEKLKLWENGAAADAYTNREHIASAAGKIARLVTRDVTGIINIGGRRKTFYNLLVDEGYSPKSVTRAELSERLPYNFPRDSSVNTEKYDALF